MKLIKKCAEFAYQMDLNATQFVLKVLKLLEISSIARNNKTFWMYSTESVFILIYDLAK